MDGTEEKWLAPEVLEPLMGEAALRRVCQAAFPGL